MSVIGGDGVPVVVASVTPSDRVLQPDYIYVGNDLSRIVPGKKYIVDYNVWDANAVNTYPIFPYNAIPFVTSCRASVKFLVIPYGAPSDEYIACLRHNPEVVVVSVSQHQNRLGEQRALLNELMTAGIMNPVVFCQAYSHS